MLKTTLRIVISMLWAAGAAPAVLADGLADLAQEFWTWRAMTQPFSGDDIPRLERPVGAPDWSRTAVEARRQKLAEFQKRWEGMDVSGMPVSWQVDYRLMGSAIARVRWEIEILRSWERDPTFYVDQALCPYLESLLRPAPFDRERSAEIVARLDSVPQTVASAKANLSYAVGPLTRLAASSLENIRPRLLESVRALKPHLAPESRGRIDTAAAKALAALEPWREWLDAAASTRPVNTSVGREGYLFFLREVALMPYTPEELLVMARGEWSRAVSLGVMEQVRQPVSPTPEISDASTLIAREQKDEESLRRFLDEKKLLTIPGWVGRYRYWMMPDYLSPVADFGETDDLTSLSRRREDSSRYIEKPAGTLSYFTASMFRDPRPLIAHEGVPGHFFQLVLSWAQEDTIRRHYYDSGSNEGLAFYTEEMLMQAGLFDDSPAAREMVMSLMRLRALRVEVDVKLALGQFTVDQAAEYLEKSVPMDRATARSEAAFFASHPGQAISYLVGKLQVLGLLADSRRAQGEKFDLRAVHDFIWKNGNVPLSLQRWEYLNDATEVPSHTLRPGQ